MNRFEKEDLQREMAEVERHLTACLRDPGFGGAIGEILRDVGESKGKRLRPRLLLLAGRYGERFETARERLCRLGALVERGEYPCDMERLGAMVEDICWRNAMEYFGF